MWRFREFQTGSGANKATPGVLGKTTVKPTPEKKEIENVEIKPVVEEKKKLIEPIPITPAKIVHPGIAYIDAFLNNPTIENLKAFCTAAKSMEGYSKEKVLNQDRTNYEMRTKNLYQEAGASCSLVLGEMPGSESYAWTYYSESYLLPLTDQGESDEVRKKKIEYNSIMAGIFPFKLFAYDKSLSGADYPTNTPREVIEAIFARPSTKSMTWSYYRIFTHSFIVPEKRLREIKEQLYYPKLRNTPNPIIC